MKTEQTRLEKFENSTASVVVVYSGVAILFIVLLFLLAGGK